MLFNSWQYALFLPIVLLCYYRLPLRWQNRWLLAASYVFYGCWDWRFLSLLVLSTVVDFECAARLARTSDEAARRRWLHISLGVNLGVLGLFKYFNFFADSAHDLLKALGFQVDPVQLSVILPVGISFYTFQTLSYTLDVYRRRMVPVESLETFALYVSFFPQLVAGPIERAERLLPQLGQPRRVTWQDLREGGLLILLGLFKKVAVADVVAESVTRCFQAPGSRGSLDLWLGLYLFAIQIYCDFSGYSSIARGSAKLLGIDLMVNFRWPYFAHNVADFWHRWHISLSTWLRDYLYIPLGGNRHGALATYRNLMLTMLLGGLWHGANWTFVVWGALHGIYLVAHRLVTRCWADPPAALRGSLFRGVSIVVTLHLVLITWVFFRAADFLTAWIYLSGLFRGEVDPARLRAWLDPRFLPPVLLLLVLDAVQYRADSHLVFLRWHWLWRGLLYAVLLLVLLIWGSGQNNAPFIYFQF